MHRGAFLLLLLSIGALSACGDKNPTQSKGPPPTLINVAQALVRPMEHTESAVGSVENIFDPVVAAEVAGRVTRVHAELGTTVKKGDLLAEIDASDLSIQGQGDAAEIARLRALLQAQERHLQRQQQLKAEGFISQNAVDDVVAQRDALREQVVGAQAQLAGNRNSLSKTRIVAPIASAVEERLISPGDYVKVGDPLFRLVGKEEMRVRLPFPESAAPRLRVGQQVRLSSPLVPNKTIVATIDEITPLVSPTSRALDVIVRFQNDGSFRGGGTINATVVTGRKENAIMVPEQSVVLRPAGKVVYLINDGKASQRMVETGLKSDGMVEILNGLSGGETVARDGAGFLTNDARVNIQAPPKEAATPAPPKPDAT